MLPIGPLMKEHRLIEKVVNLMKNESARINNNGRVHKGFIEGVVDFFKTYADAMHHGKEEDILFKKLADKNLSEKYARIMKELLSEHKYARELIGGLDINIKKSGGNAADNTSAIVSLLDNIVDLYPKHIEKEDKAFFFPAMDYLSNDEKNRMLEEFDKFDRQMIHEKYEKVFEYLKSVSDESGRAVETM